VKGGKTASARREGAGPKLSWNPIRKNLSGRMFPSLSTGRSPVILGVFGIRFRGGHAFQFVLQGFDGFQVFEIFVVEHADTGCGAEPEGDAGKKHKKEACGKTQDPVDARGGFWKIILKKIKIQGKDMGLKKVGLILVEKQRDQPKGKEGEGEFDTFHEFPSPMVRKAVEIFSKPGSGQWDAYAGHDGIVLGHGRPERPRHRER
jgi:hypothetical protein